MYGRISCWNREGFVWEMCWFLQVLHGASDLILCLFGCCLGLCTIIIGLGFIHSSALYLHLNVAYKS